MPFYYGWVLKWRHKEKKLNIESWVIHYSGQKTQIMETNPLFTAISQVLWVAKQRVFDIDR